MKRWRKGHDLQSRYCLDRLSELRKKGRGWLFLSTKTIRTAKTAKVLHWSLCQVRFLPFCFSKSAFITSCWYCRDLGQAWKVYKWQYHNTLLNSEAPTWISTEDVYKWYQSQESIFFRALQSSADDVVHNICSHLRGSGEGSRWTAWDEAFETFKDLLVQDRNTGVWKQIKRNCGACMCLY